MVGLARALAGRTLRLARALSPRLARPDDGWAAAVLPAAEWTVFRRMDPRDREHAVRVARRLVERHPGAPSVAVRAALLHDCGKCLRPYDPLERVRVGLWSPVAAPPLDAGRPTAAQVRLHHPAMGARLIREAGGDDRVALAVERHHAPGEDPVARLVHEADAAE